MIIVTADSMTFPLNLATQWACEACLSNAEAWDTCTHWKESRLFYVGNDQVRSKWQPWRRQTLCINTADCLSLIEPTMKKLNEWFYEDETPTGCIWLYLRSIPRIYNPSTGENMLHCLPPWKQHLFHYYNWNQRVVIDSLDKRFKERLRDLDDGQLSQEGLEKAKIDLEKEHNARKTTYLTQQERTYEAAEKLHTDYKERYPDQLMLCIIGVSWGAFVYFVVYLLRQ